MASLEATDPAAYRIGQVRIQAPEARPLEEGSDWYELRSQKQAEIDLEPEAEIPGDDPVIQVNYGSRLGTVRSEGAGSALTIYEGLVSELGKLLGHGPGELFAVASEPTADVVPFRTSDPDRLVHSIKDLGERGPIEAPHRGDVESHDDAEE